MHTQAYTGIILFSFKFQQIHLKHSLFDVAVSNLPVRNNLCRGSKFCSPTTTIRPTDNHRLFTNRVEVTLISSSVKHFEQLHNPLDMKGNSWTNKVHQLEILQLPNVTLRSHMFSMLCAQCVSYKNLCPLISSFNLAHSDLLTLGPSKVSITIFVNDNPFSDTITLMICAVASPRKNDLRYLEAIIFSVKLQCFTSMCNCFKFCYVVVSSIIRHDLWTFMSYYMHR